MFWWNRPDGHLVKDVELNRRVMPYLMRSRNESVFYFEYDVALHRTDAFVREFNATHPATPIDPFHVAVYALRDVFHRYPTVNRFVAGGRLYQRDAIWMSYAVKRQLKEGAPISVVKRCFPPDEPFAAMVANMAAKTHEGRFGGPRGVDRELELLFKFPGWIRRLALLVVRTGDRLGLLPRTYIEQDPMFASAFLAHMASFGMPAGFHHLYEYGSVGVFGVLGRPTSDPGSPSSGPDRRRTMRVTWSFDERVEDGFTAWRALQHFKRVLEDPASVGLEVEGPADLAGL